MENITSVYIVEDESIVAKDIQNSLKKLGYNVLGISNNGADAIKQIVDLEPSIVLMDIMIKGSLTGIDVAEVVSVIVPTSLATFPFASYLVIVNVAISPGMYEALSHDAL